MLIKFIVFLPIALLVVALMLVIALIISENQERIASTVGNLKFDKNWFQKALTVIVPSKTSRTYHKLKIRLKESGLQSVTYLYKAKIISMVLVIAVAAPIIIYNTHIDNLNIIKKTNKTKIDYIVDNKEENSTIGQYKSSIEELNMTYYNAIKEKIGIATVKRDRNVDLVAEVLIKDAGVPKEQSVATAQIMIEKIVQLKDWKFICSIIFLLACLGYVLPNLILVFYHGVKAVNRETEKFLITEIVISLGLTEGMKIEEILNCLVDSTKIYKYIFKECLDEYESGHTEQAFKNIDEKTNDSTIIELGSFLYMACTKYPLQKVVSDYEKQQVERKMNSSLLGQINQDKIVGIISVLASSAAFAIVFAVLIGMMSIMDQVNI